MKWYDVEGYDRPLLLSPEHAEQLGAKEYAPTERPDVRASKQTWVDFAIGGGADPNYVAGLTKQQLVDEYGA
jgi:hypothetical protein